MATVRIYRVAEILGTSSQEVVALLKRDHGIDVKSASSTIEEVVARQFVERLAKQRNVALPPPAQMFAEGPMAPAAKPSLKKPGSKAAEPVKPAAPAMPAPRLIKTIRPPVAPAPVAAEHEAEPVAAAPAGADEPQGPAVETAPAIAQAAEATTPTSESVVGVGRTAARARSASRLRPSTTRRPASPLTRNRRPMSPGPPPTRRKGSRPTSRTRSGRAVA